VCATEGGVSEKHTYDEADRLNDTGVSYDAWGNTAALPAADAGGSELTSTYYVDNQLASQTQNGQTIGYQLDPAGRTHETISTGKTLSNVTSHYAGPGNAPAWTTNTTAESTRNISGIGGTLAATQSNSEAPVLQLTNLHGDIVATAYLSETVEKLASTGDTTEYGIPRTSLPPKYSWLGALQIPTELPSGVIAMGARSYVPQIGRFLQTDPVPGAAANAYTYTNADPVNESDPTGRAFTPPAWAIEIGQQVANEGVAKRAAEEAAARAAAEAAARAAAEHAAAEAGFASESGSEEWWPEEEQHYEEGEEGWGEYVANHQGSKSSQEESHVESGVLYQPLGGEASGEIPRRLGSTPPLCEDVAQWPCARFVPNNHNPEKQSECNRTGQHCSGRRGNPRRRGGSHVTAKDVGCTLAGAAGGAIADVPAALLAGGACIILWP
jgi:RHS repeat-associated protein